MKNCAYCFHPLSRHTEEQKQDCKASLRSMNKVKKTMGLPVRKWEN